MDTRPDRDEWLMRLAVVVSTRGTCERAHVGAVISYDTRIISTGYVGAPAGMPHCSEVGCDTRAGGGCTRTVHAEANAIAFAARSGISTDRAAIVCTHSPCLECAKLIINAGIRKFVYENEYRDPAGRELLQAAGLEIVKIMNLEGLPPDNDNGIVEAIHAEEDQGWVSVFIEATPGWPPQDS